ncbi:MAG TPA: hypothetical protein VN285_05770 [Candidatus Deferrimicrobium sp.]|nr:hypothetical protein [Candidatus Deferrimicrobium sp.]
MLRALVTGAFFVAVGLSGCKENIVYPLPDEDVIAQYLAVTEEGRELFRTENLIPDDTYTLPYDDTVYRDVVDSVWRTISVEIDSLGPYDFGHLGQRHVATAEVNDLFFVTVIKVLGDVTDTILAERRLIRYGFFVKLGDDSKAYFGWKLWGYSSLGGTEAPVNLSVRTPDRTVSLASTMSYYTYRSPGKINLQYIKLDDIDTLESGAGLICSVASWGSSTIKYYHTISFESATGFASDGMRRLDDHHWLDTLVTPSPNHRLWNVIFVQSFVPPPGYNFVRGWCVPYRVPQ